LSVIVKIFVILALTLAFGILSFSFISTGHHMMLDLFVNHKPIWILLALLIVRATLTLSANASGLTGGVFIPVLALGALVASILGECMLAMGLDPALYSVILVLGITACIAGGVKMPLTAVVFSVEALSSFNNILSVIITALVAYLITEMMGAKSMNDTVIELREDFEENSQEHIVIDTYITVQAGSFAVGKQIRDIFWPRNLFVLSLKRERQDGAHMDEHGNRELLQGDILHVRYSTANEDVTREELFAIVGEQTFKETETTEI
jgi:hypothetical protein